MEKEKETSVSGVKVLAFRAPNVTLLITAEIIIKFFFSFNQELVKQQDGPAVSMLVETFIRLDYNTGEWKTYKIIRKPQTQQQNDAQAQQQNQSVAT